MGYTPLSRVADFFSEAQSIMPPEDQGCYQTDLRKYQEILIRSPKMTSRTLDLDMALTMYGSHICSDPRDNIYALLGISKSSDFPVDYAKPLVNLYWEVLALIYKDKDSAQLLRGTGEWLQHKMGLSDDEVWKRWTELVKDNQFPDMWGYQFVEAMRMIIGELTNTPPQQFSSASFRDLPAFRVDFADIAEHNYKTAGKKSIMALYALFNRVSSTHPSTISTALEFSTYGPELGDYFVGIIVDANPISTSECETQRQLYADGQALIPFPIDQATKILQYSSSPMIEHCRRSETKHLLLATDASSQPNELLPLAKDDIMCMFSGYQAALILRRLPGDKVLCGVAVVKFKSSGWFGRAVARFPMANAGSREVKSGTDRMGKLGAWKPSPSVVQVFMKPHSFVKITNWKAEIGGPWRGPLLNRCLCKPGEGGCI